MALRTIAFSTTASWQPSAITSIPTASTILLPMYLLPFILALSLTSATPALESMSPLMMMSDTSGVKCGECEASRCPQLTYCEGKAIKDSCNCCTICSSPKYQPHVTIVPEDKCDKVECPKFQVCVANLQGLPLCKCPSEFLCRTDRKRPLCGSDGRTYESRCQMRISSCNQGMLIWKRHRGNCTPEDVREGEVFQKKMKRKMRRKERRRKKKEREEETKRAEMEDDLEAGKNEAGEAVAQFGGELTSGFGMDDDVFGAVGDGANLELSPAGDVFGSANVGAKKKGRRNKENKKALRKKMKKRRRRKRKQRKANKKNKKNKKNRKNKGGKKDKVSRRRRRRKRQHRPKSRSKRHRILYHPRDVEDDTAARERAFEAVYGRGTWWT